MYIFNLYQFKFRSLAKIKKQEGDGGRGIAMDIMLAHPFSNCEMGDLNPQSQSEVASQGPPSV